MLPCIAAVAIATFVGKKTLESHAYETSSLLMQNVEALSANAEPGGDDDDNSECLGIPIYEDVGVLSGETDLRIHLADGKDGEYGVDRITTVKYKQCMAKGRGKKSGHEGYPWETSRGEAKTGACLGPQYHKNSLY